MGALKISLLLINSIIEEPLKKSQIHLVIAGEFYEPKEKYLKLISKNNLVMKKDSSAVSTVDIPVTIAKILGVNYPVNVDGIPIEVDFFLSLIHI